MFVDLRGFSPDSEPMDPAAAIRGFLDALGVEPSRLPVDPHAQAALFRSTVAGRRMLIVADNATDAAQIAPLLPGGDSCTVLVTSRRRLPGLITGHGADHLALDVLTDTEARTLLTSRLGASRIAAQPSAADGIIGLCGGFPLALSIVAGHAHMRPHLPLAALAAQLRDLGLDALDDEDPAASLPAVLSWSYHALGPEQATTFALLGIAPGPDIDLPAAAALTGWSTGETRVALRGLEQASLVAQDTWGRYRMHDLIRAYAASVARDDLTEQEREAGQRRVLDFYTHTAYAANRLVDPHRPAMRLDPPAPGVHPVPLPDGPAARTWLDAEYRNLVAAQRTAATRAWHHTVWQLAWTLTTFQQWQGHLHDQVVVWRAGLDAAEHLPDPAARILAHRLLGRVHSDLRRAVEATAHLDSALALAEQHHDPTEQAHTHMQLALIWQRRGDDRRALHHGAQALNLFRTVDQPVSEARALNTVGWYAARTGDHDTALARCRAALALFREHHHPQGEADTLDSLGWIAHRTGNHGDAVDHYRAALALFRELGNTYQSAETLDQLGDPHLALGQQDEARAVWREALELYRQQGRDNDIERVRRQLDALDHPDKPGPSDNHDSDSIKVSDDESHNPDWYVDPTAHHDRASIELPGGDAAPA
ncbi:tetratricopeptide repeat protein [Saccharothrix sp. ALI-22-I]|nr:tetratricopeptide repeat protein [Saccharothrix sp. ALI-22-I]